MKYSRKLQYHLTQIEYRRNSYAKCVTLKCYAVMLWTHESLNVKHTKITAREPSFEAPLNDEEMALCAEEIVTSVTDRRRRNGANALSCTADIGC